MARFRATIQGSRGMASRLGTPRSGLEVTANGWNHGVKVFASVDSDGNDRFTVVSTGGSNGGPHSVIAEIIDGRVLLDPFDDVVTAKRAAGELV